jgi:agmatinase
LERPLTRITLIGLPTDRNSSYMRGPAQAPAAIRALMSCDMGHMTAEDGADVGLLLDDRGDLALNEDEADHAVIAAAAADELARGPALFLGGDHFVTWPILEGLHAIRRPVHIVHFDAHSDCYPHYGGNRASHASPFARIMEAGLAASLTQIGVRTVNAVQQAQIDRFGIAVFGPDDLDAARVALPSGDVYVSFDLDGLDPAFAPGVSHHEPGGLTVRQALSLIRDIPGRVIGADVVEYNPARDLNRMTAAVAAKLVKELAARMHGDNAGP